MTLLFLDTETTGLSDEDRVCQVAFKVGDDPEVRSTLCRPPIEISPSASAVTHITNDMVADLPPFEDTRMWNELHHLLHVEHAVLVAHNAPFDIRMIGYEHLRPSTYICTKRVAQDVGGRVASFSLQYLRYHLNLPVPRTATAHDAAGDVEALYALYQELLKHRSEEEMLAICSGG